MSRVGGWTVHWLDQLENNRIVRPSSIYIGGRDRSWPRREHRARPFLSLIREWVEEVEHEYQSGLDHCASIERHFEGFAQGESR